MLTNNLRLKKTADFKRVYEQGRYKVHKSLVFYYLKAGAAESRYGFVVSKKVGKSHVRNRVKRLLRAVVLEYLAMFPAGYDYIFVARPPIVTEDYRRLILIINQLSKKASL